MAKSIIVKIDDNVLSEIQIDRIIEMAWEDRTPFDAIKFQFNLSEADVKSFDEERIKVQQIQLIHEPWKLNRIEQQFYKCEIGKNYPEPIVDIEETRKYASDSVWGFRNNQKKCEELKSKTCPVKPASSAKDHLHGEKNGKRYGTK